MGDEVLVRSPASGGRSAGSGGSYAFDDPFFRRWVQVNASADLGHRPPRLTGAEMPSADGATMDTPSGAGDEG